MNVGRSWTGGPSHNRRILMVWTLTASRVQGGMTMDIERSWTTQDSVTTKFTIEHVHASCSETTKHGWNRTRDAVQVQVRCRIDPQHRFSSVVLTDCR